MKMTIHAHPPVKTYEYPPHPTPPPTPVRTQISPTPGPGPLLTPPVKDFGLQPKKPAAEGRQRMFFLNYPVIYKTPNFCSNVQHKKIWPSLADGNFFSPPLKIVWAPLWVSQGRTFTHTPPSLVPKPYHSPRFKFPGTPPPRSDKTPRACMKMTSSQLFYFAST